MPDAVRAMIHPSVGAVPPYGHEDATLLNPRAWPSSMEFLGKRLTLYVSAGRGDDVVAIHQTVATVKPGWSIQLGYTAPWKMATIAMGPAYQWDETGRLYQRSWYEPDTVRFYARTYRLYLSGRLCSYSVGTRNQDFTHARPLTHFSEYFDRDGILVGVEYDSTDAATQYWWKAEPLPPSTWKPRITEFWRSVVGEERKVRTKWFRGHPNLR